MKKIFSILIIFSMIANFSLSIENEQSNTKNSILVNAEEVTYEYRYCEKKYITSESKLSSPYIYVSEKSQYSEYGEWSEWSTNFVTSSDTREVQTEIRQTPVNYVMVSYRTRGNPDTVDDNCFKTTSNLNVRSEPNSSSDSLGIAQEGNIFIVDGYDGNWVHTPSVHTTSNKVVSGWLSKSYLIESGIYNVQYRNYSVNGNYSDYDLSSSWGEHCEGSPWVWSIETLNSARQVTPWSFVTGLTVNDGTYNADGYNMTDQTGYILNDGYASFIWFIDKINYNEETWYKYRDRTQKIVYTYYSLGEWSEWSTTPISETNDIIVEKREVEKVTTSVPISTESTIDTTSFEPNEPITTTKYLAYDVDFEKEIWNFINSSKIFGKNYYITDDDYNTLISNLSNTEIARINTLMSNYTGECYGMSVIQALCCQKIITPDMLQENAKYLKEVTPTNDVISKITYYYLLQATDTIYKKTSTIARNENVSNVMSQLVSLLEKENTSPCVINYGLLNSGVGHSVVGYGVEYGKWEEYPEYDARILVYDNRSTEFKDENCIYFNTKTYHWYIPYQKYGWNGTNKARIYFFSNSPAILDNNGLLGDKIFIVGDDDTSTVLPRIVLDLNKFNIFKTNNSTSFDEEIVLDSNEMIPIMDIYGNRNNYILNNESSEFGYIISPKKDDDVNIGVNIEYSECSINTKADNTNKIGLLPNGSVSLNIADNSESMFYEITEIFNNCDMPWSEITINGISNDNITISPTTKGYTITGLTENDMLKITVNDLKNNVNSVTNKYRIPRGTTSISVAYQFIDNQSAKLIVISNDDLAILTEDTNIYGDVNLDGKVDVLDLIELKSYILSNKETINVINADLSLDNKITTIDLVLLKKNILNIYKEW